MKLPPFTAIIASNYSQSEVDTTVERQVKSLELQFRSQVEAFAAIMGESAEARDYFLSGGEI